MGNHYSSCEFNVISYGTQRCVGIIFVVIGKQQWGLTPALQSSTITFPVETSNSLFVELTPQDSVNGVAVLLELNNKGFNFAINAFNATGYPSVAWLLFGIAQQWGLSTGRTITYPISLLVLYSIVALDAASGMDAVQVCDVNTADNTNAIIFQMRLTQGDILPDNMTGFYWILIGRVQQWGYVVGGINTFTVTFLITYIAAFGATASGAAEVATAANTEVSELTNTGFTLKRSSGPNPVYWIAWGKQQWGSLSNWSTGANSYTYPIAFSERTYSLAYSITTVRESAVAIYNATKTEFTYSTNAASTSVGISVIFLGKQQWGTFHNGTNQYPVSFTEFAAMAAAGERNENTITACSVTGFTAVVGNTAAAQTYLAAGVQQWGYNLSTTGDGTAYDLLIACSDFNLGYISNNAGAGEVCGCTATLTSIKLSRATRSNTLCWTTLGKQQWGFKNVTGNGSGTLLTTIKFPTAFSACWAVTANIVVTNDDYDVDKYVVIGEITVSQFKATIDSEVTDTEKTFKVNWLAIGQQQNKGQLRSLYR